MSIPCSLFHTCSISGPHVLQNMQAYASIFAVWNLLFTIIPICFQRLAYFSLEVECELTSIKVTLDTLALGVPDPPRSPPILQALLDSIGLGAPGNARAEFCGPEFRIDSWLEKMVDLEREFEEWQYVVPVCNICMIHLSFCMLKDMLTFSSDLMSSHFEVCQGAFWPGFWMIWDRAFKKISCHTAGGVGMRAIW